MVLLLCDCMGNGNVGFGLCCLAVSVDMKPTKTSTDASKSGNGGTISDFPGLGILSGWNIHTGLACPTCNLDAEPCRLRNSNKWCFMGHRHFLSRNHKFRLNRVRFDGSIEE